MRIYENLAFSLQAMLKKALVAGGLSPCIAELILQTDRKTYTE